MYGTQGGARKTTYYSMFIVWYSIVYHGVMNNRCDKFRKKTAKLSVGGREGRRAQRATAGVRYCIVLYCIVLGPTVQPTADSLLVYMNGWQSAEILLEYVLYCTVLRYFIPGTVLYE